MQENIDYDGEEGFDFEKAVFGQPIGPSNFRQYMQMLLYTRKEEREDSENSKKQSALQSVIRNFSNLPAGTYIWNGSKFVRNEQN